MTFGELRIRYSHEELTRSLGDPELRYRVCAPFFQNLFESKVVYYEKFIGVVRLDDIEITPERFRALAIPQLDIERSGGFRPQAPTTPWYFGGIWAAMTLGESSISSYSSWTIWPEPDRVQRVEEFAARGCFEEALKLTIEED